MKKLVLFLSLIICAETALPSNSIIEFGGPIKNKTEITIDDKVINNNAKISAEITEYTKAVTRYTNALALNKEADAIWKYVLLGVAGLSVIVGVGVSSARY